MTILFDLDGTLTDPGEGITNSVMYALRSFGITPPPRAALYSFIGPPLADSFAERYGFDPAQCRQAIAAFREYFEPKGKFENVPYPGIRDMLHNLRHAGHTLVVATSKPEQFAREILEHFGLDGYFAAIVGSTMDETRVYKHEVIGHILQTMALDPAQTVMVGDRRYDVEGAARCGLRAIGVLYGYGSREELSGAMQAVSTVGELEQYLLAM